MKRKVISVFFSSAVWMVTVSGFFFSAACEKSPETAKFPETVEKTSPALKVYERWREGGDKLRSRKWEENGDQYREDCHLDPKGKILGCGTWKNGKPWNGFFVKWHSYNKPSDSGRTYYGKPEETRNFRNGLRHGTYRKYYPNGALMREIEYENGKQVRWKAFAPNGEPYHQGKRSDSPEKNGAALPDWE